MRAPFARRLRCPACGGPFSLDARATNGERISEGALRSACGQAFPIIASIPRVLPVELASCLAEAHPEFFERHPDLLSQGLRAPNVLSLRTLRAFGDEWQRFPELLAVHARIFEWYFEGREAVRWSGLRVLDAGCGMGRWLHFARREGAEVVGMDLSPAIDVVAQREGDGVDLVQADLRWPPFAPADFDLVYSLGVVHHLEDPRVGVRSLAALVRPGGQLRLYVYRSLDEEGALKRGFLAAVTAIRRLTVRLPFWALHAFVWIVALMATLSFLIPRRLLRHWAIGDRLTRSLPLVHYVDVPFRMLVAEQFDRFGAPIEGRFRRTEVESWLKESGLEDVVILPDLGWRAIGRRPVEACRPPSC